MRRIKRKRGKVENRGNTFAACSAAREVVGRSIDRRRIRSQLVAVADRKVNKDSVNRKVCRPVAGNAPAAPLEKYHRFRRNIRGTLT